MKKKLFITAAAFSFLFTANAQAPEGFVGGSVSLADGSTVTGYVKDNIKKDASVIFTDEKGANKKKYDAANINGAMMDGSSYLCIKGDFFKTICIGKICFLQKASNAGSKAIYNGSEAIFSSGTPGKIGDYFSYSNNELKHITKKTLDAFISGQLASCAPATEKAKSINGNIAALAEAVTIYNNMNKQ